MSDHQYKLWEYEQTSELKAGKVCIVKNRKTGHVAIQKLIRSSQKQIYLALQEMQHPNLPEIYGVFDDGEESIVLREYVQGKSLQEYLDQKHNFSHVAVKEIACQLCDALISLHNHVPPIIHRDIKLSNVILSDHGDITLLDFDAARFYDESADHDTVEIGTHGYAAPEAYGFHQTNARSDLYSLGVLLNLLLTGKKPSEGLATGYFRNIIKKCTDLSPANRYKNALQLKRALRINGKAKYLWISIIAVVCIMIIFTWQPWKTSGISELPQTNAQYIEETNLTKLSQPLEVLTEIWHTSGVPYPQDTLTNEYINQFLYRYCNTVLKDDMQDYREQGISFTRSVRLSMPQIEEIIVSVFGNDKFDVNNYQPPDYICEAQGGYYYFTKSDSSPKITVEYVGDTPIAYNDNKDYAYSANVEWEGDSFPSTYDMLVRIVENPNSIYGYSFQAIEFLEPVIEGGEAVNFFEGAWRAIYEEKSGQSIALEDARYLEIAESVAYEYANFDAYNNMTPDKIYTLKIQSDGSCRMIETNNEENYYVLTLQNEGTLLCDGADATWQFNAIANPEHSIYRILA